MTVRQTSDYSQRLVGPDLARGVMLLLIAMVYAGVYVGAGFGTDASGEPLLDQAAAFAATLFLDNRAFPMFAILFGYGLAWSIARGQGRGIETQVLRRGLRRRALLLLAFGIVHAILVYTGEILTSYGLALLVTGWLLFRSDKALKVALWVTGIFYLLCVPLISMVVTTIERDMTAAGIISGYASRDDWVGRLISVPYPPLYMALAYGLLFTVILGRAGRARLFERTVERRALLLRVAVGGVAVSLVGALPAALIAVGVFQPEPAVQGLLQGIQILTGVAGGAGYAACFALTADSFAHLTPAVTRAIAAVGKRSLTFYIFNSAVVAIVLHPDLIGLGTVVGQLGALVVATLGWLVGLVLASWLEHAGRPGPLEALMRRGIYGRARQPV